MNCKRAGRGENWRPLWSLKHLGEEGLKMTGKCEAA